MESMCESIRDAAPSGQWLQYILTLDIGNIRNIFRKYLESMSEIRGLLFLFTESRGIVYSRSPDTKKKESIFGSQAEVLQMNWSFIVLQ